MDKQKIELIIANIEMELNKIKSVLPNAEMHSESIDTAGANISSMGDMIRDAL